MSKKGGAHPPHPKCPECGKAMYKTMVKGKTVATDDPWAYCRNQDCPLYGKNQSDRTTADERDKDKPKKSKPEKGEAKKSKPEKSKPKKGEAEDKPEKSKPEKSKPKKSKPKKGEAEDKPEKSKPKKQKIAKVKNIKADIISGKFTTAEIIHKNKTSRKTVSRILKQMKQDGEI